MWYPDPPRAKPPPDSTSRFHLLPALGMWSIPSKCSLNSCWWGKTMRAKGLVECWSSVRIKTPKTHECPTTRPAEAAGIWGYSLFTGTQDNNKRQDLHWLPDLDNRLPCSPKQPLGGHLTSITHWTGRLNAYEFFFFPLRSLSYLSNKFSDTDLGIPRVYF